jgi:uncharacterized membrane protein
MSLSNKAVKEKVDGVKRLKEDGSQAETPLTGGIHLRKSVSILRSPDDLYNFWRDFSNLARFMPNIESVEAIEGGLWRWKARGPASTTYEWEAVLLEDRPNELISWRSIENADVDNAGSVSFRPSLEGHGTHVRVELTFNPPAGALGDWLSVFSQSEPAAQLAEDLRRFKQLMETGEIPTSARRREELPEDRRVRTIEEAVL